MKNLLYLIATTAVFFCTVVNLVAETPAPIEEFPLWKWEIEPKFWKAGEFSEDLAPASKDGSKWGFIDKTGKWIIQPQFNDAFRFSEGLASAKQDRWGFIDKAGKWIILSQFDDTYGFSDGLAGAEKDSKWGFIDKQGNWVISPRFEEIYNFFDGLASVKKDGEWYFIDKTGKRVIQPQFEEEGHAIVREKNLYGVMDKTGKWIIPPQFGWISSFYNGWAIAATTKDTWGIIDTTGRWIIQPQFEYSGLYYIPSEVSHFEGGMMLVNRWEDSGRFGYISLLSPDEYITTYIVKKLKTWQQKDEYESTTAYQQRTSKENRDAKIKELFDKAVSEYVASPLFPKEMSGAKISTYDADHHTFLLTFPTYEQIVVKVSADEARSLKENWEKVRFPNANFAPVKDLSTGKDKIVLLSLTIINTANNKQYTWNIADNHPYQKVIVKSNFEVVNVASVIGSSGAVPQVLVDEKTVTVGLSDVDVNIPQTKTKKPLAYALIIGNEDYSKATNNPAQNVPFAANDAKIFKEYCVKTLGVPEKQVKLLVNATAGNMLDGIDWLVGKAELEKGEAELIVFYSGHGLPDERSKAPYLIPTDLNGKNLQRAVSLKYLYEQLNAYPTARTTLFLDACFSGGARNGTLIADRKGVMIKPSATTPLGNAITFSSSSNEESSGVYKEKQHGYFTYYLLKNLQTNKGNTDYNSLRQYLYDNVRRASDNDKRQTPQVLPSPKVESKWRTWRLSE